MLQDLSSIPNLETLFEAAEIESRVAELGRRLDDDLGDRDPLYLALVGGSVIFVADLVRALAKPIRYEFVQIDYRHSPEPGTDDLLAIHYPFPVDLEGQNLVVVKDVVSSGIIEAYLGQQLQSMGAAAITFVGLLDLSTERKTAFELDYRAFNLRRSGTFVGYGLKYQGRFGNLPTIARLPEPFGMESVAGESLGGEALAAEPSEAGPPDGPDGADEP